MTAKEATSFYHVVGRCIRRAFLYGRDRFTGRSFEHRRVFIESEILRLGLVFFLDVAAYAVMSNHRKTDTGKQGRCVLR